MDDWRRHAWALAGSVTHSLSRWRPVVAGVPRHVFVPRWFERASDGGWTARDGADDPQGWVCVAYRDRTVVTRIDTGHADDAETGATVRGRPTSSATLPSLLLQMYRHAMRSGLVEAATARGREAGVPVRAEAFDVTGELPGEFDRIVATFSVPHVPASWVTAVRPGGRVVVTLADTGLILVLDKQDDGTLRGVTAWDRAGFMPARHDDTGHEGDHGRELALAAAGDVRETPFPLVDVTQGWPLWSTFNLENPGVRHDFTDDGGGTRRALMWADDGSWARAESRGGAPPTVTQGGPRLLWDALDTIRERWLREGDLPCYGAKAKVEPDGTTVLWRGRGPWAWKVVRVPCPRPRPASRK